MLARLLINNFIIVETVEIDFSTGMNAIVGETGAGKSIIANALMLLFGSKATVDYVRSGAHKAVIEGNFFFNSERDYLFQYLESAEIECESNEIIIRREIPLKGSSRCFINDSPVTLAFLKYFSQNIVDFHVQNEQQKILEKSYHLTIIDNMMESKSYLLNYKKHYKQFEEILKQYNEVLIQRNNSAEREEVLIKLLDEINEINPVLNEDIQIDNELKLLENSEFLISNTSNFISILDNEVDSLLWKLNNAQKQLDELTSMDERFLDYKKEFAAATISINETLHFVRDYQNNIEFNPLKVEQLRSRYAKLRKMIKKYGSLENAINKKNEFEEEINLIQNYDNIVIELEEKLINIRKMTREHAIALSDVRKEISKKFEEKIVNELAALGLENVILDVKFNYDKLDNLSSETFNKLCVMLDNEFVKINETGMDDVEFLISTNKGETLAPIDEVASGGEISRIMLAIKTIMSDTDDTPILIFDEIDTGISGRVAQKVGLAIKNLSNYHQVITITHLPQIAAICNNFILVEKIESNNRAITTARNLNEDKKIIEIAKLFSGENVTDTAIRSAKELIIG